MCSDFKVDAQAFVRSVDFFVWTMIPKVIFACIPYPHKGDYKKAHDVEATISNALDFLCEASRDPQGGSFRCI